MTANNDTAPTSDAPDEADEITFTDPDPAIQWAEPDEARPSHAGTLRLGTRKGGRFSGPSTPPEARGAFLLTPLDDDLDEG